MGRTMNNEMETGRVYWVHRLELTTTRSGHGGPFVNLGWVGFGFIVFGLCGLLAVCVRDWESS